MMVHQEAAYGNVGLREEEGAPMPAKPSLSDALGSRPPKRGTCRVCGEPIAKNASKCVHCNEYQTRDWSGLRGKTLWDLLSLLIVPAVLAVGGFILDRAATERQNLSNEQRAQSAALQAYFDKIGDLLLQSSNGRASIETLRTVARAKTTTTLHELDGPRKGLIIKLLLESNMLQPSTPVMTLRGANLENAELSGVNLSGVDLFGSSFGGANLQMSKLRAANLRAADFSATKASDPANLRGADLFQVNLIGAKLAGADLRDTDLRQADLFEADLRNAELSGAMLYGAFMEGAKMHDAELADALLCGTTMPDKSESNRDCEFDKNLPIPILDASKLLGTYSISGTNPLGADIYKGDVVVNETDQPNRLQVHWKILHDTWDGEGSITDDGQLYITYSGRFDGDILLTMMPDGSLSGEWRAAGPVRSALEKGHEYWVREAATGSKKDQ